MKRKDNSMKKNHLKLNNNKIKKKINFSFKLKFYERLKMTIDWYNCFYKNRLNLENLMIKQINYIIQKIQNNLAYLFTKESEILFSQYLIGTPSYLFLKFKYISVGSVYFSFNIIASLQACKISLPVFGITSY